MLNCYMNFPLAYWQAGSSAEPCCPYHAADQQPAKQQPKKEQAPKQAKKEQPKKVSLRHNPPHWPVPCGWRYLHNASCGLGDFTTGDQDLAYPEEGPFAVTLNPGGFSLLMA